MADADDPLWARIDALQARIEALEAELKKVREAAQLTLEENIDSRVDLEDLSGGVIKLPK